jgi:hypothetical protein
MQPGRQIPKLPTNLLPLLPQTNIMSEGSSKILENIYHTVHHHIPKECLIHCLEQLKSPEIQSHYRYMLQHGFSDTFVSRYLSHYLNLSFHSISLVMFIRKMALCARGLCYQQFGQTASNFRVKVTGMRI